MAPDRRYQFEELIANGLMYWQQHISKLIGGDGRRWSEFVEHLVRAVELGLDSPSNCQRAVLLSLTIYPYIEQYGSWLEWLPIYERACQAELKYNERFYLLIRLGQLYRWQNQLLKAIECHQMAEKLAEKFNQSKDKGIALFNLSADYNLNHQYVLAEEEGQEALNIFQTLNVEPRWLSAIWHTLGHIAQFQGKYDMAVTRIKQAVAWGRKFDDHIALARVLNSLANVHQINNEFDKALFCFEEALYLLEESDAELDWILVNISKGALLYNIGQHSEAIQAFLHTYSVAQRETSYAHYQAILLMNLANVYLAQNLLVKAEERIEQSLRLWHNSSELLGLGHALGIAGEIFIAQEKKEKAKKVLHEAICILEQYPDHAYAQKLRKDFEELLQLTQLPT